MAVSCECAWRRNRPTPQARRRLGWRIFAYPIILLAALWWSRQQPITQQVDDAIWQQPLIELAAGQRGRGLDLPLPDQPLPSGHLTLLWWDNAAALAFAPANTDLPADQQATAARTWQSALRPTDLPDLIIDGVPLRDRWLELPLVPWPQGWKVLLRKDGS
jgi:hypothetical protein